MMTTANTLTLSTLETRKLKRTGYVPAFLGGGLLAAMVPVLNMAVRREIYVSQSGSPFHILMDANWQLMAQLNIFLLVCHVWSAAPASCTTPSMPTMASSGRRRFP